jgi:hypothetical protein
LLLRLLHGVCWLLLLRRLLLRLLCCRQGWLLACHARWLCNTGTAQVLRLLLLLLLLVLLLVLLCGSWRVCQGSKSSLVGSSHARGIVPIGPGLLLVGQHPWRLNPNRWVCLSWERIARLLQWLLRAMLLLGSAASTG